nr:transcription factor DIVARICATA-like isoform X2 [Ipomoea trifida]
MTVTESSSSVWSRELDKAFENALATYPEDLSDRWEKIAADVPGKSLKEVKLHYEILMDDVSRIESGCVPLPYYDSSSDSLTSQDDKKGGNSGQGNNDSHHGKSTRSDQERRKGIAWTEEEHRATSPTRRVHFSVSRIKLDAREVNKRGCWSPTVAYWSRGKWLFLLGLDKYGKGDWRSISRNFVVTRTPTQVASHAQKYFIRLNSMNKDRRRSSIHDITSVNSGDVLSPQGPITGQTNGTTAGSSSGKSNKQPAAHPGVGVYGPTTIGQPVGGPLVSAVGTPVNLPPPAHMAYGVRPPIPGQALPGVPGTYPMPHR